MIAGVAPRESPAPSVGKQGPKTAKGPPRWFRNACASHVNLLATRLAFNAIGRAPIRQITPLAPQFCVLRFPAVCSEQKKKLELSHNEALHGQFSNECATRAGCQDRFRSIACRKRGFSRQLLSTGLAKLPKTARKMPINVIALCRKTLEWRFFAGAAPVNA